MDKQIVVHAYTEILLRNEKGVSWRLVQDGGVEGRALTLARALKSQLTAEQSSTGRHWNSPKKITDIQRQRRSRNETVGGAQSQENQVL